MSRQLPTECPHGQIMDWGDFGAEDGTSPPEPCEQCNPKGDAVTDTEAVTAEHMGSGNYLAKGRLRRMTDTEALRRALDRLPAISGMASERHSVPADRLLLIADAARRWLALAENPEELLERFYAILWAWDDGEHSDITLVRIARFLVNSIFNPNPLLAAITEEEE